MFAQICIISVIDRVITMDSGVKQGGYRNGNICNGFDDGTSSKGPSPTGISHVVFLKFKHNAVMFFDHSEPAINESTFQNED